MSLVPRMTAWRKLHKFSPKLIVDLGCAGGDWTRTMMQIFPEAQYLLVDGDERCRALVPSGPGVVYETAILDLEISQILWTQTKNPGWLGGHTSEENTPYGRDTNNFNYSYRETSRLSDILERSQFDTPDYLQNCIVKLDLQGAEHPVLYDLFQNTCFGGDSILIMETSLVQYNRAGAKIYESLRLLDRFNYELRDIADVLSLYGHTTQFDGIYCHRDKYDAFKRLAA
jgi:hypothetical protein